MTLVIKQHKNNNYYISLEITIRYERSIYLVQVCPLYDENMCGYPIREMTYSIDEKKKALATFNRYKRNYI